MPGQLLRARTPSGCWLQVSATAPALHGWPATGAAIHQSEICAFDVSQVLQVSGNPSLPGWKLVTWKKDYQNPLEQNENQNFKQTIHFRRSTSSQIGIRSGQQMVLQNFVRHLYI
jgi:hypothetical protein